MILLSFAIQYFSNSATEAGNHLIFEIPDPGIDFLKLIGEHILIYFKSFWAELRWAEVRILSLKWCVFRPKMSFFALLGEWHFGPVHSRHI